jgi:hypothetical protein
METTTTPIQTPAGKWKKRFWIALISVLILFIVYVVLCGMSYSTGARTGIVLKISQKGYVFKTYEGELNLGGLSEGDGTIMPTKIWNFSVQRNDTAIYNALTNSQGKHVRLHYKEVYKAFFWQSETPYYVEKVEIVH